MGEVKKAAEEAIREVIKKKSLSDKLFYWAIFKTTYHVTFVYHFLKGLILRRW
jgi:hypothetical protein